MKTVDQIRAAIHDNATPPLIKESLRLLIEIIFERDEIQRDCISSTAEWAIRSARSREAGRDCDAQLAMFRINAGDQSNVNRILARIEAVDWVLDTTSERKEA